MILCPQIRQAMPIRKLFALVALATAGAACQPQAAQKTTTAPLPAATTTIQPLAQARKWPPLPTFFAAADTLTAPQRALLQAHDLSSLWQNDGLTGDKPVFEGFFGPDHYHFAMAFTRVVCDPADPALYHVWGKCRYRKNIRPFSGTLLVRQLVGLSYPGFLAVESRSESGVVDSVGGRTYTAHAQLQLVEEVKENSGLFEGEVLLDFYVLPSRPAGRVYVFDHEGTDDQLPTRGAGLLLRGRRRNVTTGQVKSFIVSPDVAAVAPFVFKDFMLDERMGQINPKYAKLGWNEFWSNEEWWADSPKPGLNI
jgi:hypothetical protein